MEPVKSLGWYTMGSALPFMVAIGLCAPAHAQPTGGTTAARAAVANAPKTPAIKTITNFSQTLRCMDELFLAYGKQGIVITSAGIPDETGKVRTGTKEMVITAIARMTVKSNAFEFIDFHSGGDDLKALFDAKGEASRKLPDYYIRGSITQMDDNAVRKNKGFGISLPFLDLGASKDESFDLLTMDMSVGDASTRRIIPVTSTSNTMVVTKGGKSGEGGGRLGKLGLSFNVDLSQSEGIGASTRTLLELGLVETLGKFTQVPYWRCLDADLSNPMLRQQALEGYEILKDKERIMFVQRKLGGSMNRYKGPIDGELNDELKTAIAEYQVQSGLTADGRVSFEVYASLLDDTQNQLAAVPTSIPAPSPSVSRPQQGAAQPSAGGAEGGAPAPASSFRVNLITERGAKPSYKVGEFLNLSLSVSAFGTAFCYYEDAKRTVARIFPNQFHPDSVLKPNAIVRLPSSGFRIRFDDPGRERIACIGSDQEIVVPSSLKGSRDLTPLATKSLDEVVAQFRQNNAQAVASTIDISVSR